MKIVYAVILIGAIFLRILWYQADKQKESLPKNTRIKFQATIKNEPKISFDKQVIEIGDSKIISNIYPRYKVGERILVEGKINSRGEIFFPEIQKLKKGQSLGRYFADLRGEISQNINKLLPEREATLVGGTVLGVDTISRDFRDELIKTGTIHVVVVSGQNLTLVAGIFLALTEYLGRRQSLLLATGAVFAYAFLTGFEPPVVRAAIMVLASTVAIYLGREVWPVWNLALAALVIIFIWPSALFEVSFQLTFAATLGIMTLGQYLVKAWQKVPFLGQNAAIATSAYLFTAPIILFHFGKVWPLSPVANILVVEAVFPIMVLGFLIAFSSLIFMPLAQLFAFLAYVPAFYFAFVIELFSKVPVDQLTLGRGSLIFVVFSYLILAALVFIWTRKPKFL